MKPRSHQFIQKLPVFAVAFLSLVFASPATQTHPKVTAAPSPAPANSKSASTTPHASTNTKAPAATSPAVTNAAPVQAELPKSVFLIPATPRDGKDPFFPRSMRLFSSVVVKTEKQPTPAAPAPAVELRLNGISGSADHRLAIINNQTFETNEEGEVPTRQGRTHIHCLEIKPDSVLVQVGAEQRVLHLRPDS